jgi:hypothetical protein
MNSVTAGLGAANGNSLRIRLVTVERPVENASEGASSRSWIVTDRVEYYYRGNVQENATAQSSASYRGLGDAGDLAMVISRNRLPLPEARQQPSSAGAAKWRTRVYQYRYTNALKPVGQSTFVVSKQIRAIFSPEQIELLAIQNPTLGGVQPLVAGDAGVEGVAWSILGLPDRTELTFGSD